MLQGAFTPPYWPALPAQMLGSISLCGGARSNCPHPQNISRGKNIRSSPPDPAEGAEGAELSARPRPHISTGNARIQVNFFIFFVQPPKIGLFAKIRYRVFMPNNSIFHERAWKVGAASSHAG